PAGQPAGAGKALPAADLQVYLGHLVIVAVVAWAGADPDALSAVGIAFEYRLESVELSHLGPHLPGDHRRHEPHEPGRLQVKGEPDPRAVAGLFGELECAGRSRRARGDQEFEPARPVEDRDPVVPVDAPPAGSGKDLTVGGALAHSRAHSLDQDDACAPVAIVGAVSEVVEDVAGWPVDRDGVLSMEHRCSASLS